MSPTVVAVVAAAIRDRWDATYAPPIGVAQADRQLTAEDMARHAVQALADAGWHIGLDDLPLEPPWWLHGRSRPVPVRDGWHPVFGGGEVAGPRRPTKEAHRG